MKAILLLSRLKAWKLKIKNHSGQRIVSLQRTDRMHFRVTATNSIKMIPSDAKIDFSISYH
jgi:hypothetical protein